LFAGAIAYGSGGLTVVLAGEPGSRAAGPLIVEQQFLAGPFSAVDVARYSGGATQPFVAELRPAGGSARSRVTTTISGGDGYARLRFDHALRPGGLYVLRLEVPAGAHIGTLVGPSAPARAGGRATNWTVDLRLHRDAGWQRVAEGVRAHLKDGAGVMAVTALLLAASFALIGRHAARRTGSL
jgi:hypothetical protein